MEEFDFSRLEAVPSQLLQLLVDPTSNLTAALVLYGIIGLALLIVLLIVVMFVITLPDDDEDEGQVAGTAAPATTPVPVKTRIPVTPKQRVVSLLAVAMAVTAVWAVAGYTTSQQAVCESCHVDLMHSVAEQEGRSSHASTGCTRCHEPSGVVGQIFGNLPFRIAHFADGMVADTSLQGGYGRVTRSACYSCHRADISQATLDVDRGLRMSHTEPLDAGADCLDCHTYDSGAVGQHNAGMNPCLRCHDADAATADCSTCHDKAAAAAARSRSTSFASVQVAEVRCGSCHDEKRQCDSCHGTRLPHTKEFMAYAHARAGAVDFWYNGGRTCAQCHTPTRRPCGRCHDNLLGRGHGGAHLAQTHQKAAEQSCNACHQRWAYRAGRDFCTEVCHTPAAIESSPR